ncbi:UNVERIFIED_CONTAM: hypothetical protein Sangu_0419200 [Sesamum angustifolium]|uniref:Uncharacterized protein n=1 Tax=Sesamum angustifolium TaxID=2727405 RepID=A0AAW2QT81_9LAMI
MPQNEKIPLLTGASFIRHSLWLLQLLVRWLFLLQRVKEKIPMWRVLKRNMKDGIFRKRSLNKCLIPYARRRRKCEQGSDSSDWEVASASFLSRTESRRLRRVSSVLREPLRDNLFDHCFRLESSTRTPCMLLLDSLHTLGPLRLEPLIRRFVLDIYETEDRPECKDMVQNIPLLVPQMKEDWFTEEELEGFYKRLESLGTESSDSDE